MVVVSMVKAHVDPSSYATNVSIVDDWLNMTLE